MTDSKHKNYEILNLIGYGLAKFDMEFVRQMGFGTKQSFFESIVQSGIADTTGTVKNRQDLFDPFFENGRKGWWQKGDAYLHRKKFIDSLFGDYDSKTFADLVKLYIESKFDLSVLSPSVASPIVKSKFKQLQITGREAEMYFVDNFREIDIFNAGLLEDARLFGDGYDFQIQLDNRFVLTEIKGVRSNYGSVRLTEKEFQCAVEYGNDYGLVVVSNLEDIPKMTPIMNPSENLVLERKTHESAQVSYHTKSSTW